MELYQAVLSVQPDHPDANHGFAVLAVDVGQPEVALPLFEIALAANPGAPHYWLSYIGALIQCGRDEQAHQQLQAAQAAGLNAEGLEALADRLGLATPAADHSPAVQYQDSGRHVDAVSWLKTWLDDHPEDSAARARLVSNLLPLDRDDEARHELGRARQMDADHPAVKRAHAEVLIKEESPDAVAVAERAMAAEPDNPDTWLLAAQARSLAGDDQPALRLIARCLAARPRFADALALRARIRERSSDIPGALADAEAALEIKPSRASLLHLVGTLRLHTGDLDAALAALRAAHEAEPQNISYLVSLGTAICESGRLDDGLALLHRAARQRPDDLQVWHGLGAALYDANRLEEAEAAYEKALSLEPRSVGTACVLGSIAIIDHRLDKALGHFDNAHAQAPDAALPLFRTGEALSIEGRLDEAQEAYVQALRLAPGYTAARSRLNDLHQRAQADALLDRLRAITWIASYPKSGATWLRFLVSGLHQWAIERSGDIDVHIPSIQNPDFAANTAVLDQEMAFLQTHRQFSETMPGAAATQRAVYIVRNPFDVLTSNMNFLCVDTADARRFTHHYIRHAGALTWSIFGFGNYLGNVQSWLAARARFPVHLIRYEDLLTTPRRTVRRLADFLALDIPPEVVDEAIAATGFDRMKDMEEQEVQEGTPGFFTELSHQRRGKTFRFMNKGRIGSCFDALSDDDLLSLEKRFAPLLSDLGYRLDLDNRRIAVDPTALFPD